MLLTAPCAALPSPPTAAMICSPGLSLPAAAALTCSAGLTLLAAVARSGTQAATLPPAAGAPAARGGAAGWQLRPLLQRTPSPPRHPAAVPSSLYFLRSIRTGDQAGLREIWKRSCPLTSLPPFLPLVCAASAARTRRNVRQTLSHLGSDIPPPGSCATRHSNSKTQDLNAKSQTRRNESGLARWQCQPAAGGAHVRRHPTAAPGPSPPGTLFGHKYQTVLPLLVEAAV